MCDSDGRDIDQPLVVPIGVVTPRRSTNGSIRASGCSFRSPLINATARGLSHPRTVAPDHLERRRAPAVEHLVDTIAAADGGNEVAWLKSALVHTVFDRLHWVGEIERVVPGHPPSRSTGRQPTPADCLVGRGLNDGRYAQPGCISQTELSLPRRCGVGV